jgi:hypothetical protein
VFRGRSAIEIMVIVFTFVIAASVVGTGILIAIVKIQDPASDVSTAVSSLTSVVASILAALLGLVAGKSEALQSTGTRPGEEQKSTVYERPQPPHDNPYADPTDELQWQEQPTDRDK